MKTIDVIRIVFQVLLFGVFVYQMKFSAEKFIDRPVVQKTMTKRFHSSPKPTIYVCQENQFDLDNSKSLGYRSKTRLLSGDLIGSDTISWNGKYGNQTFNEVQNIIFSHDYKDFVYQTADNGVEDTWRDAVAEEIFEIRFGLCKKSKKTKKGMNFRVTKNSFLYIDDPEKTMDFRISSSSTKFKFGPTTNNRFDGHLYQVQIILHDSSIFDGVTCTNYAAKNSTYGQCIQNELKQEMESWYGCLAPWFSQNSGPMCEVNTTIKKQDSAYKEYHKLVKGLEMDISEPCLPPCITMTWQVKELYHASLEEKYAWFELEFVDDVIVHVDMEAYDIFNLIVDLGSALGLWLGLSALCIFDLILEISVTMINRLKIEKEA